MSKITCKFCLQPEAALIVTGERSSQYGCRQCGEVFEVDHTAVPFTTEARPQELGESTTVDTGTDPLEREAARQERVMLDLPDAGPELEREAARQERLRRLG